MLPNPSCWEDTVGKGKLRVMLIGGVGVDRSQQSVHTRSVIRQRDEKASGKEKALRSPAHPRHFDVPIQGTACSSQTPKLIHDIFNLNISYCA